MNCIIKLFPSYCVFQDQALGMMIGSVKARDGLYHVARNVSSSSNKVVLNVTTNAKVLL